MLFNKFIAQDAWILIVSIAVVTVFISIWLISVRKKNREKDDDEIITQNQIKNEEPVFNYKYGASSHIGSRNYQQDAYFIPDNERKQDRYNIAILCDGMGGMEFGGEASRLCVRELQSTFYKSGNTSFIPEFFREQIIYLDDQVSNITTNKGKLANSGTTLASVIVRDDSLFWASVGDSRIYIFRSGQLICLTRDHNYEMQLMEKVEQGLITEEDVRDNAQKNALISYIGIDGIEIMDISQQEFELESGDIVLICSDGIYGSMADDEIAQVLSDPKDNIQTMMNNLVINVLNKDIPQQDNMTAVGIQYFR